METRVAVMSIIVEDPDSVEPLNTILHAKTYLYSMSNKRSVHKWKDIRVNLYT